MKDITSNMTIAVIVDYLASREVEYSRKNSGKWGEFPRSFVCFQANESASCGIIFLKATIFSCKFLVYFESWL